MYSLFIQFFLTTPATPSQSGKRHVDNDAMWAAMSPSPPAVPGTTDSNSHRHHHHTPDHSSRHVYVHHINERQAPQQQYAPPPQSHPMFMPMPYPQPQPMPMFMGGMGGGYGFHSQPQPQPPVIIVNGKSGARSGDDEETDNGSDGGDKTDDNNDDNNKGFSSILLVSIIFVFIGSILGFVCVGKVYDVFEHSMENDYVSDYFVVNRQVALGIGAFATLCYCIAFMLAFYAGMKYKMKCDKKEKKQCCRDGLLIAAWVIFCLTSINNLIILILAFDEEARIYPEVALCAVIGSIVAWLFVFGWAEMTRRSR